MIEKHKFGTTTIKEALDVLTDWNWHTERLLIETILSGDSELINDMLIVALHHSLQGHLTDEMSAIRRKVMLKLDGREEQ